MIWTIFLIVRFITTNNFAYTVKFSIETMLVSVYIRIYVVQWCLFQQIIFIAHYTYLLVFMHNNY